MVLIQSLIQYLLLILIFLGPLARITIFGQSIPIIDISLVFFTLITFFLSKKAILPKSAKTFLLFIIYAWINLLINYFIGHQPLLIPILYLIRLTCLILLFVFPLNLSAKFISTTTLVISTNVMFGLLQYFIWPDLTYMKSLGWDDHLNRLVSTYLDPTFTGLIYTMFFIYLFLLSNKSSLTNFLTLTTAIAIALTYSRSSFLSLFMAISVYYFFTSKYLKIIIFILLIATTIIILPRRPGEGTKLERSSSVVAKVSNLKEGLTLFKKSPMFGIGYNNIINYKNSPKSSHSLGGYDLSWLNILITNGLVGTIILAIGYYQLVSSSKLFVKILFLGIFIHSLFANSFFYPYSTILLAFYYHYQQSTKYQK